MIKAMQTTKSWLIFSDGPQDKEFEAIRKTRSQNKLEFFSSSSFFEALRACLKLTSLKCRNKMLDKHLLTGIEVNILIKRGYRFEFRLFVLFFGNWQK